MKRILFCTGILALAASCTNNEFESLTSNVEKTEGIAFSASVAPMSRIQWEETETSYKPFWYAEQDRITIYPTGVMVEGNYVPGDDTKFGTNAHSWAGMSTTGYEYKATQSAAIGKFTATADDQTMNFVDDYTARFFALYGEGSMTVSYADGKISINNLPDLSTQTQENTSGYNKEIVMYSMSTASKENSYDAVGENVNLNFQRPTSAIVLSTENIDKYTAETDGVSIFGKLKTINVVAEGYNKDGKDAINEASGDVAASFLTYPNDAVIKVDTLNYSSEVVSSATDGAKSTVTLTLKDASGLTWNDKALAVVATNNVNRKAFRDKNVKENVKITWTFGNVKFVQNLTTSNDWNGFHEVPALDIDSYNYLYLGVGSEKTLIINKGTFSDALVNDNGKLQLKWNGAEVAVTEVDNIISNVALTNEELSMLSKFTGLTKLTLAENTVIPEGTLTNTQVAAITDLSLPKVTKVEPKFAKDASGTQASFAALVNLNMPSYEFENDEVNKAFFNDNVKDNLQTLNLSGVRSMLPKFGIERTLSFSGYDKLESVTVKNGMIVSPHGFYNCSSLAEVNGTVDITNAPYAFATDTDKSILNQKLTKIDLASTIIPNYAFAGCKKLSTITSNNQAIKPTEIGTYALRSTSELLYLDLSEAKVIGDYAFYYSGITSNTKDNSVLTVGVQELNKSTFAYCTKLKMVKFTEANTISGNNVFDGCTGLIQIKFLKEISLKDINNANAYANVFGGETRSKAIDLWVNPSQQNVNGLALTLNYKNGNNIVSQTYNFKSIQKKIED